jgi:benzoyl-CoA reductase/2-hydroxyglutaryl-CoA dehydratase subunit BcrC/BadD/HgdB
MKALDDMRFRWNVELLGPALIRAGLKRRAVQDRWRPRRDEEYQAPPLKASWRNRQLVAQHWLQGRHANLKRHVAWVTSGAPVEPLKALDYYLVYPENHAALCGTARLAVPISEHAEGAGYSRDLCSYARTDLGSLLSGRTPVGRLPKPDLLMACTNICQTVLLWYRVLADHFRVPLVLIDTPFVYADLAKAHALSYVVQQLEEGIQVAEAVAGRTLDAGALQQTARYSQMATELWLQILQRNRHRPAPITAIDQFILMAPIVEMRGDPGTVDFYAEVLQEIDERIANGVGAVKGERLRVLWDNLPIWHSLRFLAEFLGERGISIVASTYTNAWGELASLIDPAGGLESMARVYTYPILNRGTGHKLRTMAHMVDEYQIDGVILHSDRSCKPYSVGQMDQRDRLTSTLGKPALLLEADHNDTRVFSEQAVSNRLAAFAEMLGAER